MEFADSLRDEPHATIRPCRRGKAATAPVDAARAAIRSAALAETLPELEITKSILI